MNSKVILEFIGTSDPRRIRTFDLLLRRQLLYPAELWNQRSFYKKLIKKIVAGLFYDPV